MKAAVVLCVVAAAWAAPQGGYNYQAPVVQQPEYQCFCLYKFVFRIYSYYVQLPDSRLMRVTYYSDASGFHPTVTFEGEAQYPSAPAQVYSQPAPAPAQVYVQPAPAPAPAPTQVYVQPAPAPAPAPAPTQQYAQPAITPSQFYSQPGK
ncbi:leucine-rich repeat extensin-like protein 5 [Penaeus monodon]|uniref:leucine-rich repeat extensin-like protein 5 n=1 Tax=Penaeus monodon TaxID=6687 RepID=UPI0018A79581|nr:leucine-rich repeat extensin-like protein 5 [Penaeus monodon]